MKKSQHAILTIMEIRNIRTFGYNVQGIYTLESSSRKEIEL